MPCQVARRHPADSEPAVPAIAEIPVTQAVPASRTRRQPRGTASPSPAGPAPTLRILETRVLRGPNYWAREPAVRLLVDLGVLEPSPTNQLPNFTDALVA